MYSHIYKTITLMFFGHITDIPKFTSFVFSRSLHAREIKPTRRKQIFYYFTATVLGPKMSQRSVSYDLFSFSQQMQMALSVLGGFFLPLTQKISASRDTLKHLFFPLLFFVFWGWVVNH